MSSNQENSPISLPNTNPNKQPEHPVPSASERFSSNRFSGEQRKRLERGGFYIYRLTGTTIKILQEKGFPFWSRWHEGKPIEDISSVSTEVAVNPSRLFLVDSNRKSLTWQQEMVEQYAQVISGKVPGTTAIMGTVADYAELAHSHFSATKKRLFESGDYTRTVGLKNEPPNTVLGNFDKNFGLVLLQNVDPITCRDFIWVAPLVIPDTARSR